jgi:hypothetical protein
MACPPGGPREGKAITSITNTVPTLFARDDAIDFQGFLTSVRQDVVPLCPRYVRALVFWRVQRKRQEVNISFAARSGAVIRQLIECSIS